MSLVRFFSTAKSVAVLSGVNDLLDFCKIEAGHLEFEVQEFPIHHLFEDSVKLFNLRANEKGLVLKLNLKAALTL